MCGGEAEVRGGGKGWETVNVAGRLRSWIMTAGFFCFAPVVMATRPRAEDKHKPRCCWNVFRPPFSSSSSPHPLPSSHPLYLHVWTWSTVTPECDRNRCVSISAPPSSASGDNWHGNKTHQKKIIQAGKREQNKIQKKKKKKIPSIDSVLGVARPRKSYSHLRSNQLCSVGIQRYFQSLRCRCHRSSSDCNAGGNGFLILVSPDARLLFSPPLKLPISWSGYRTDALGRGCHIFLIDRKSPVMGLFPSTSRILLHRILKFWTPRCLFQFENTTRKFDWLMYCEIIEFITSLGLLHSGW